MGLLSSLTAGGIAGAIKGFGSIATDLRKMRLNAEVAMAQTKSAERKEELRAEIERLDRLVAMSEQAGEHMRSVMSEWWMKLPMLGIMCCALFWVAAVTLRSAYQYGAPVNLDPQMVEILKSVIYSMFGVAGLLMATNRLKG